MKRNLKALGLAMVAVFALSAVAASAAQAANHHLTVPTAPAIVTAEDTVNTVFSMTGGNRKIECATTKYEGTVSETTSTEVTVAGTYGGCTVKGGGEISATVDVKHCALILTGETDANGDAKTHIECAEGNEIHITYSVFGSACTVAITPQTPEGGVHYEQAEPVGQKKDVTVTFTIKGITYHEIGGGFCPASSTTHDGTLNGTVTAKAYKDNGPTQAGTEKTTPTFNEGEQQDLTLSTT